MKPILTCFPIFLVGVVVTAAKPPADASYREIAGRVDSLYRMGTQLAERDSLAAAARRFQAAIKLNKKHAPSHVGLGQIYLQKGDLKTAEKAFRRALRWRKNYAPALNGLGNVFLRTKNELRWAIKYFQYACQADKTYTDAYYNLAVAYRTIGDTRELDAYKRLVKTNPTHWDGWFQIGRIFQTGESGQYVNLSKAELAYRRQLEVNLAHFQAHLRLGEVLKELDRTEEAARVLRPLVEDRSHSYQYKALEVLAEVQQKRREYEESEALYDAYIAALDSDKQVVFYDLSLVAEGAELERFKKAPKEQWRSLSEAFWAARDPAPVTIANERRIEHFRRVAYSLEHFGRDEFPWDARGEVYVRYGMPDHISQSDDIRFETDVKVIAVKERLINQAGRGVAGLVKARDAQLTEYDVDISSLSTSEGSAAPLGPISSMLREISETGKHRTTEFGVEGDRKGTMGVGASSSPTTMMKLSGILGWPVYPVQGKVWEYWIYTDVGLGIEITFTQPYHPGPFYYADMPLGIGGDSQIYRVWQQMNPRVVIDWAAAATPSVYRPDFASEPLEFFFDSAQFKGLEGTTILEVYYGVPVGEITIMPRKEDKTTAYLQRGLALYNEENRPLYRSIEDMELDSSGPVDATQLAFVPEMDRLSVAPGAYRLSVQILDKTSDKSQVYNREVVLYPYGDDSLRVSDIQMAALIRPNRGSRFTKGDIEVVPNPSLAYLAGQPVFIYYEVYNLNKDEFGRTKYRVSYELHSLNRGNIAVRTLKAIGRLVGIERKAEVVTVEYAHEGDRADEYGYLEMDMSDTEPGIQLLKVQVTDDISGERAVSTARFTIQ